MATYYVDLTQAPRERFSDIRSQYREMDDDTLAFELVTLGAAIGELRATLKDDGGNVQCERLLSFTLAKSKLAHNEKWRREREAEEREAARKQANFGRRQTGPCRASQRVLAGREA